MQDPLMTDSTIEENFQCLIAATKDKVTRTYAKYEKIAIASPGRTVLLALASGYCLHRLPVRALLVLQVRAAIAVAPAVLLGLGAVKLCGILQRPRGGVVISPDLPRHAGEFRAGR